MNCKTNFFVFLTVFFFLFSPLKSNASLEPPFENPEITISMDLKDAGLADVLKVFAVQSGMNFVSSEGVQDKRITLYLEKVPIKEAMDKIFNANNLSYELDRNANIFIVKDLGGFKVETLTKVFYLKYTTVSTSSFVKEKNASGSTSVAGSLTSAAGGSGGGSTEDSGVSQSGITKAIGKLLSSNGSVIEDYRTNSLIVTDAPNRMPAIAKLIADLDVITPQVLLEVEMLDVSKNTVDNLGIKFGKTPLSMVLTGAQMSTGWPFLPSMLQNKNFAKSVTAGNVNFNNSYTVLLDFLRTQTDTKYLARPRILTLSNETAEIRIATNESIGIKTTTEASSGTTSAEAERSETGVILRVTPQVSLETGEITMCVYPKVSEATTGSVITSNSATYTYRDPEERSTKSTVRIKDGDTVVIGGLIRNELTKVTTKLPFLGDIPWLGKLLFTHTGGNNDKDRTRELLIFITPHIIQETGSKVAQVKLTKIPEREQNASAEGANREGIINSSLNDYDKKRR